MHTLTVWHKLGDLWHVIATMEVDDFAHLGKIRVMNAENCVIQVECQVAQNGGDFSTVIVAPMDVHSSNA